MNISHITVEFENPVISIDLIDGIWKRIDDLTNDETYLFFIEAVESTKVQIGLFIYNYEYNDYELAPIGIDGAIRETYSNESFPLDYIDINAHEYKKKIILIILTFIKVLKD